MEGTAIGHDGRLATSETVVRLQVLGALRAVRSAAGQPDLLLELGGPRPRRLLFALAVDADRPVPPDRLAERVWGDRQPSDPRAALYTMVSRLRQVLGPEVIVTEGIGYRLAVGPAVGTMPGVLDALTFEDLVRSATVAGSDAPTRLALLEAALALWAGDAFDEVAGERWVQATAARLEELRLVAVEQRFDAMLGVGRHADAVPLLMAAVREHPLRDALVGQLMLALHHSGRQAEAARAFQDHRARLAAELGLEPGAGLIQLDRRLLGDEGLQTLPSVTDEGRALRGYRLLEQLGEGTSAVVFRGIQPTLEREVAVKVIRPEVANRPAFIRRFEAEAQLVAALEHPHIVPLYDYWREPDRAYLVFRYLRGGSLHTRLAKRGPLDNTELQRLVTQVGTALETAHLAGVPHRDVRAANIFCDDQDNFYLGDFGIVRRRSRTDGAAPLADDLAADIGDFGEVLLELTSGPGTADVTPRLPAGVLHVVAAATTPDVARRFTDMSAFVRALLEALANGVSAATPHVPTEDRGERQRNPYKGLRPFGEADAADFKGRTRAVEELLDRLRRPGTDGRLAVVIGPSGIGKSSLVQAGLLPALRCGAIAGSEDWYVATMVPGRDPFDELRGALRRIAGAAQLPALAGLDLGPDGLDAVARAIVPTAAEGGVLLVVDQFEELFTLTEDDAARRRFLAALEHGVTAQDSPLRVVITLRADFYDRPLRYGAFGRLAAGSLVSVMALAPDELDSAIVEPALAAGCEFEPGLVTEIAADVGERPGALPLLQHTLSELWQHRASGLLTRDAYRSGGGVAGTLASTAERLYQSAEADEQALLRRLFGRLVSVAEGHDTRRRALRSELGRDARSPVIDRFGQARLLTFDRDPATREPTVEVAHEALLDGWPRLRAWIDEDREDLAVLRHLSAAARAWEDNGRDDAELYRGGRLERAEQWATQHDDRLNEHEAAFLTAATARRHQEQRSARRQVRRLRGVLATVVVVACFAVLAGMVALGQQRRAETAAADAETRRLVADAAVLIGENRDVALLLAAEAYRRAPGPQTLAGLQRVLTASGPYLGTYGAGSDYVGVAALDDATVVGLTRDTLDFFDPTSAALRRSVPLPAPAAARRTNRVVATDGRDVVAGLESGAVVVVRGDQVRVLQVSGRPVRSVAVDDGLLAAGTADGVVHLFELASGVERWATPVAFDATVEEMVGPAVWADIPDGVRDLYRSSDAELLQDGPAAIVLAGGRVVVTTTFHLLSLDRETGSITRRVPMPMSPFGVPWSHTLLAALPDGRLVAGGTVHATVFSAELETLDARFVPTGRPDINLVATAVAVTDDGTILWGLSDGRMVEGIADQPDEPTAGGVTGLVSVRATAPAPDGSVLAAGDGGIVAWSTDGKSLLARAVPSGARSGAVVSADATMVAATSLGGTDAALLYDLDEDPPVLLPTPADTPSGLVPTPDPLGRYVDRATADGIAFVERSSGRTLAHLPDAGFQSFSFDGRFLALSRFAGNGVRVFDGATFEQLSPMLDVTAYLAPGTAFEPVVPGFNHNGSELFISLQDSATTVVYATATWAPERVIRAEDHGGIVAARFSRDGGTLVTIGIDGAISVRDPHTWAFRRTLAGGVSGDDPIDQGLYLSAHGEYLLTTRDGQPRLWHLPSSTL
ncbi:MAG: BTAD domain-containing putative transcriptional regulator, partial [Acidimicrobiia bacterium]